MTLTPSCVSRQREIDLRVDRMYKVWVTYLEIYNEVRPQPCPMHPTQRVGLPLPTNPLSPSPPFGVSWQMMYDLLSDSPGSTELHVIEENNVTKVGPTVRPGCHTARQRGATVGRCICPGYPTPSWPPRGLLPQPGPAANWRC